MDRDETLRRAEKSLRQGRLDIAIGECTRVAAADAGDLARLNTLGDLTGDSGGEERSAGLTIDGGGVFIR